jgi:FKBP-type peptidyl-prolyl cis-trans isomerase (trigger factor)
MKSKVVKLADYQTELKNFKIDFKLDEAILDEALKSVVIKNKQLVSVNKIEKGDIVTVNLKSEAKKFNKNNVKIIVGSNYFSKDFEAQLIGLTLAEEKIVEADGFAIDTRIVEINRISLPELNDELIKNENIDGIKTVADYKKLIYETNKEKYIQDEVAKLSMNILQKLSEESKFDIDDEDVLYMCNNALDFYRKVSKEQGLVFEEMTREQLMAGLAAESIEEVKTREKGYSLTRVKYAAICSEIQKKDISGIEAIRENVYMLQNEFINYIRGLLKV